LNGTGIGLSPGNASTVKDCTASGNNGNGIYVGSNDCLIAGNTCSENGNAGISIVGGLNRIDYNTCADNLGYGIVPLSANVNNTITRNSAHNYGTPSFNYGNYSGNLDYAPVQVPNTATLAWGNFY